MKNSTIATLMLGGAMLFASCGVKETFEMFNNPIHVQGDLDPNFGLPLASGQVRLDELLGMLGTSGLGLDEYVNADSTTVTLMFSYEMADSIDASGSTPVAPTTAHPSNAGKPQVFTKENITLKDTTFRYPVDITFFDNIDIEGIEEGNMAINHLWLDFDATMWGTCPPESAQKIQDNLRAKFYNIKIIYTSATGEVDTFHDPELDNLEVNIDNILEGEKLQIVHADLAEIINAMPRKLEVCYSFRFDIVGENVFGASIEDIQEFTTLIQNLEFTKLYYDGKVHVELPLDIMIVELPYTYPVNLPEGSIPDINAKLDSIYSGLDVDVLNSHLFLALENHMPLDINIEARFQDANDNYLGDNIFSGKVKGAPVNALGIVTGTADTTLIATINAERLDNLAHAAKLEVKLSLGTSRGENGLPQYVKIRRDDFLKIRLYSNLHLGASVDIPIKD